jgi:hypothetical protein
MDELKVKIEELEKQVQGLEHYKKSWDALGAQIATCYCNVEGDYDEENPECEGADLCVIGEMAATAFGWL